MASTEEIKQLLQGIDYKSLFSLSCFQTVNWFSFFLLSSRFNSLLDHIQLKFVHERTIVIAKSRCYQELCNNFQFLRNVYGNYTDFDYQTVSDEFLSTNYYEDNSKQVSPSFKLSRLYSIFTIFWFSIDNWQFIIDGRTNSKPSKRRRIHIGIWKCILR